MYRLMKGEKASDGEREREEEEEEEAESERRRLMPRLQKRRISSLSCAVKVLCI